MKVNELNKDDEVVLDRGNRWYGTSRYLRGYVHHVTKTQIVIHCIASRKQEIARYNRATGKCVGVAHGNIFRNEGAVAEKALHEAWYRKLKRFDWSSLDLGTLRSVGRVLSEAGAFE